MPAISHNSLPDTGDDAAARYRRLRWRTRRGLLENDILLNRLLDSRAAGQGFLESEKNLAFNLGGHINHSIFWKNLAPGAGGEPEGELATPDIVALLAEIRTL